MRGGRFASLILAAAGAVAAATAFAAPGDLDASFGSNGRAILRLGQSSAEHVNAAAVQPDGKIVLVGEAYGSSSIDVVVARLTPDGAFDPSFGGGAGYVLLDTVANNPTDRGRAVALQPDGRIVVAGMAATRRCFASSCSFYSHGLVARFNADGSIDTSFGGGAGWTKLAADGLEYQSVAVQPDGKIVAAGSNGSTAVVQRLDSAGLPDTSFASSGSYFIAGTASANAVALQPDGKIVLAGQVGGGTAADFLAVRLTDGGVLDPTFGGTGKVAVNASSGSFADLALALQIQSDGKILMGGYAEGGVQMAAVRLLADGTPDTADFGAGTAVVRFNPGGGTSAGVTEILAQGDGTILLAGYSSTASVNRLTLARLAASGALDSGFADAGVLVLDTSPTGNHNYAAGAALQVDGKVVLVGPSDGGIPYRRTKLLRVTAAGALDAAFAAGGVATLNLSSGPDDARAVAALPDGKVLVAGNSQTLVNNGGIPSSAGPFAVAKLTAAGALDPAFGAGTGVAYLDPSDLRIVGDLRGMAVQPDGKIVLAGRGYTDSAAQHDFAVARLNADGSVDTSFNGTGLQRFDWSPVPYPDTAVAVAIQSDGKIVIAGDIVTATYDIGVVRLNASGGFDSTFGPGTGKVVIDGITTNSADHPFALALQPDGKIVIVGSTMAPGGNDDVGVVRLDASGVLDATFGSGGKVQLDGGFAGHDYGYAAALQPDGKIVIAGRSQTGADYDAALWRLNADGSRDTSVGGGLGRVFLDASATTPFDDGAYGVAVQPDGRIVIAGEAQRFGSLDVFVARFNADLTQDFPFAASGGIPGIRFVDVWPVKGDGGRALALKPDGKIVVAGYTFGPYDQNFVVVQLEGDDAVPEAFAFTAQAGVPLSATVTSAPVQISGINVPAPISVSGGEYCVSSANSCACDVQAFGSAPGTLVNSRYVCVRHQSAIEGGATASTTLTVGGVSGVFESTTTTGPYLTVAPAALNFGSRALGSTSPVQEVQISNGGAAPASIAVGLAGANAGDFGQGNNCTASLLAAGGSCRADVVFTPSSTGARTASLQVVSDAPGSPHSVALSGTGVGVPGMTTSPSSLNFPARPLGTPSSALTVTISNVGSAVLNYASVVTGTAASNFAVQASGCNTSGEVAVSGNCLMSVVFTPSALGARTATLTINSNDPANPSDAITLTGTGIARVRRDFNGDGKSDILWRNAATGENYLYPMNGTAILGTEGYLRTVADTAWQMRGTGDYNGDGKADVLWRNTSTGENYIYLMDGTTIAGEGYLRTVADQYWQVAGVGDFNGDGKADILWRHGSSGENYVYLMDGTAIVGEGYLRTVADTSWQVRGTGDFDGDGKADILWRNTVTGENYLYPMNGTAILGTEGYLRTVVDQNWQVAGIGDFTGDGKADVLWRNGLSGENYLYPMNGTTILGTEGYIRTVSDLGWQVKGTGDYDGDGRADVLWRHAATGENYLYPMNGTIILPTEGYLRSVPQPDWQMQNPK